MSAKATRDPRWAWATQNSSYDRVVRILRYALPVAIGIIAAVLIFSPFTYRSEVSFLLSKDSVDVAKERLRVTQAIYRGQDAKGHPFALTAKSAVQKSSREPIVQMTDLLGEIQLSNGSATIFAQKSKYDMEHGFIAVDGAVKIASPDEYKLTANNVIIELGTRELRSHGPVEGAIEEGFFSADTLFVDLDARILRLDGSVRMTMYNGV